MNATSVTLDFDPKHFFLCLTGGFPGLLGGDTKGEEIYPRLGPVEGLGTASVVVHTAWARPVGYEIRTHAALRQNGAPFFFRGSSLGEL